MTHSLKIRKRLEEKADDALREFVRWRDCQGHKFQCFVCRKWLPKEVASVGHFRKRVNRSTRWMPKNCHLICPDCQYEGNQQNYDNYAQRLDEVYGDGMADYLTQISHVQRNYVWFELEDIIDSFQKLKELGIR